MLVFLALLGLGEGLGWALLFQGQAGTGGAVRAVIGAVTAGWMLAGLYQLRGRCWVPAAAWGVVGFWLIGMVATSLGWAGAQGGAIATGGIFAMTVAFWFGVALVRSLLFPGLALLGVARTMIDEAIRMKVALIFIVALLLVVPILPEMLSEEELLSKRMRFFLTWGLGGISVLLSFMTLFLACGSICAEIREKRIFTTLTKPIARGHYLLGKLLGIALLNAILVTVAGLGLWTFARVLAEQPAEASDRSVIEHEILVARVRARPEPPRQLDLQAMFEARLQQLRDEQPDRFGDELSREDRREIEQFVRAKWHTIAPGGGTAFLFTGLEEARNYSDRIQLRVKANASRTPPDEKVRLALRLNGRPYPLRDGRPANLAISEGDFHVINLPVEAVDEAGELVVEIGNVNLARPQATFPASITFNPESGMEVLYRVGDFGPNLARSMFVLWLKLIFLAMLGLMAGTFLGFPVACLLSLMVYLTALSSGFITESLEQYVAFRVSDLNWWQTLWWFPEEIVRRLAEGQVWGAIQILVRLFGSLFLLMVPSFSEFEVGAQVSRGLMVPWRQVGEGVLWITGAWTGLALLIAWLIFNRKELAKVIV